MDALWEERDEDGGMIADDDVPSDGESDWGDAGIWIDDEEKVLGSTRLDENSAKLQPFNGGAVGRTGSSDFNESAAAAEASRIRPRQTPGNGSDDVTARMTWARSELERELAQESAQIRDQQARMEEAKSKTQMSKFAARFQISLGRTLGVVAEALRMVLRERHAQTEIVACLNAFALANHVRSEHLECSGVSPLCTHEWVVVGGKLARLKAELEQYPGRHYYGYRARAAKLCTSSSDLCQELWVTCILTGSLELLRALESSLWKMSPHSSLSELYLEWCELDKQLDKPMMRSYNVCYSDLIAAAVFTRSRPVVQFVQTLRERIGFHRNSRLTPMRGAAVIYANLLESDDGKGTIGQQDIRFVHSSLPLVAGRQHDAIQVYRGHIPMRSVRWPFAYLFRTLLRASPDAFTAQSTKLALLQPLYTRRMDSVLARFHRKKTYARALGMLARRALARFPDPAELPPGARLIILSYMGSVLFAFL